MAPTLGNGAGVTRTKSGNQTGYYPLRERGEGNGKGRDCKGRRKGRGRAEA